MMADLKRVVASLPVPEICWELDISTATFYKWRAKLGGMALSMITRMKELEDENRRLRKTYLEEKLKAEIANWLSGLGVLPQRAEKHRRHHAEQCATHGYPSMTEPALKRFSTSPRNGCTPTSTNARIGPWADSPQSSTWPWLHKCSTFRFSGNWGITL